jgi:DNA repair photolyase
MFEHVDATLLPPSPWTEEELSERLRAAAEANRVRRGYNLSLEESTRILKAWVAEVDAQRGYKLTPLERERRLFQWIFEYRITEKLRRAQAAEPFAYRLTPPSGPLMVREGGQGESQLDRIERAVVATRVRLEALEANVNSFVDQSAVIATKLEDIARRVDALNRVVERIDLRVLSLEHRVKRLEDGVQRLEDRVQRLEQAPDR